MDSTAIGIDIGGTGIKGARVDLRAGNLDSERIHLDTPQPATPDAVAEVVTKVLEQVASDGPVGLTIPAVVRGGIVETAANIDQSWIGVHAAEHFDAATGRPAIVVNDADAAGMAEMTFGAGRGRKGLVVIVTLGTGIGSALFIDGRLVPNSELGHLHLHHGDAEDWAAASVRDHDDLSWAEWSQRVQHYLELVERLLWPELFIIGGGVSKKADKWMPRIKLATELVPAQLLNDAGIVGAALALEDSARAGRS